MVHRISGAGEWTFHVRVDNETYRHVTALVAADKATDDDELVERWRNVIAAAQVHRRSHADIRLIRTHTHTDTDPSDYCDFCSHRRRRRRRSIRQQISDDDR